MEVGDLVVFWSRLELYMQKIYLQRMKALFLCDYVESIQCLTKIFAVDINSLTRRYQTTTSFISLDLKDFMFICSKLVASFTLNFLNIFLESLQAPAGLGPYTRICNRFFFFNGNAYLSSASDPWAWAITFRIIQDAASGAIPWSIHNSWRAAENTAKW